MKLFTLPTLAQVAVIGIALPLLGCKAQTAQNSVNIVPVVTAPTPASVAVVAAEAAPPITIQTANTTVPVTQEPAPTSVQLPSTNNAPDANVTPAAAVTTAATATTNTIPRLISPPDVKVSAALQEIARLAESGLNDEVLLAYIENSPAAFNPTAEEVVYLTDLGLSDAVIAALIKHRANTSDVAANPTVPATPTPIAPANPTAPPVTITATPEFEAGVQPQPTVVYQTPYVVPTAPVQYDYFYSSLSPYGSWVQVDNFGLCWRPTVAVVSPGWKPYCDRGRWLYTDCGWYWQSDYSWGWAPFHYGRWHSHPRHGWVWSPDNVWGPAWVTWRNSDDYCGWAPLPPGVRYEAGIGLSARTGRIGINFDFGLSRDCYTFVPTHRFSDRTPWRHAVPRTQVGNIYNRTTIINNYVGNNKTVINVGVDRDRIAAVTRSEIRKVPVRDLPANHDGGTRPDRLVSSERELVVYRPPHPNWSGATRANQERELSKGIVSPIKTVQEPAGNSTSALPTPGALRARNGTPNPRSETTLSARTENTGKTGTEIISIRSRTTEAPTRGPISSESTRPGVVTQRTESAPAAKPANDNRGRDVTTESQLVRVPTRPLQRRESASPAILPSEPSRGQVNPAPSVNSAPNASFNRALQERRLAIESRSSSVEASAVPSRNNNAPPVSNQRQYRAPIVEQREPFYRSIPTQQSIPSVNPRQELSKPVTTVHPDKRSNVQPEYSSAPSRAASQPHIQSIPTPSRQNQPAPSQVQAAPSVRSAPPPTSDNSSRGSRRQELLR